MGASETQYVKMVMESNIPATVAEDIAANKKMMESLRKLAKEERKLQQIEKDQILTMIHMSDEGKKTTSVFRTTEKTMRHLETTTEGLLKKTKTLYNADKEKNLQIIKGIAAYKSYLAVLKEDEAWSKKLAIAHEMNMKYDKRAADSKRRLADATKRAADRQVAAAARMVKANRGVSLSAKGLAQAIELLAVRRLAHQLFSAMREGVTVTMEFHKALTEVQTIAQDNQATIESWAESIVHVAEAWNLDLIDAANARYEILSNQIAKGTYETELFAEASAKFAKITRSTAEDAVNLLTAALNAYGKSAHETEKVSAILFKTIELGRIRSKDLANTFGKALVPASQLGIELEELAAMMATITIKGVKATESMTLIRGVMMKLMKPTEQMEKLFKTWGVRTGEQAIATYGLAGVMELLEVATKGTASEIAELFGRIRATMGVTAVVADLEKFEKTLTAIKETSAEAYAEAAAMQFQTAGEQISKELNRLKIEFTKTFGEGIVDVLAYYNSEIATITGTVFFLTKATALLAATQATVWAYGKLMLYTEALTKGIRVLEIYTRHTNNARAATLALKVAQGPLALAITAALATGIALLYTAITKINENAEAVERLRKEYALLEDQQKSAAEKTKSDYAAAVDAYTEGVRDYRKEIAGVVSTYNEAINSLEEFIKEDAAWLEEHQAAISIDAEATIDKYRDMYDELISLADKYQKELTKLEKDRTKDAESSAKSIEDWTRKTLGSKEIEDRVLSQMQAVKDELAVFEGSFENKLKLYDKEENLIKDLISTREQALQEQKRQTKESNRLLGGRTGRDRGAMGPTAAEKKIYEEAIKLQADLQSRRNADHETNLGQTKEYQEAAVAAATLIEEKMSSTLDKYNEILKLLDKPQLEAFGQGFKLDESLKKMIEEGGTITFDKTSLLESLDEMADKLARVLPYEAQIEMFKAQIIEIDKNTAALDENTRQLRQQLESMTSTQESANRAIEGNYKEITKQVESVRDALKHMNLSRAFGFAAAQQKPGDQSFNRISELLHDYLQSNKEIKDISTLTTEDLVERKTQMDLMLDQYAKLMENITIREGYSRQNQEDLAGWYELLKNSRDEIIDAMITRSEMEDQIPGATDALASLTTQFDTAKIIYEDHNIWLEEHIQNMKTQSAEELEATQKIFLDFRAAVGGLSSWIEQATLDRKADPFGPERGQAAGGSVWGTDTVPTRLTPGEFVVNQRATRQFYGQLLAMNNGGSADNADYSTTVGDISINVQGGQTESQSIQNIMSGIRRGIGRGQLGRL